MNLLCFGPLVAVGAGVAATAAPRTLGPGEQPARGLWAWRVLQLAESVTVTLLLVTTTDAVEPKWLVCTF